LESSKQPASQATNDDDERRSPSDSTQQWPFPTPVAACNGECAICFSKVRIRLDLPIRLLCFFWTETFSPTLFLVAFQLRTRQRPVRGTSPIRNPLRTSSWRLLEVGWSFIQRCREFFFFRRGDVFLLPPPPRGYCPKERKQLLRKEARY